MNLSLKYPAVRAIVLMLLAGCSAALPLAADEAGSPSIIAVEKTGTNLLVHARVPAGYRCVTLESRSRLGRGAWSPRAVRQIDGATRDIQFQISCDTEIEIMRLRVDAQPPLPASFYTGVSNFEGVPTNAAGSSIAAGLDPAGSGNPGTGPATGTDATREVVESDIWKILGSTLYFFNQWRGLQVVDISNPNAPALRGTLELPASGEQMYLLAASQVVLLTRTGCGASLAGGDNQVLLVDTARNTPDLVASLPVTGWIQGSRLVGTALYVVSQTYRPLAGSSNTWEWGSLVSAFDLANFRGPVPRGTLWVPGYGNVVTATDRYLFISSQDPNNWSRSSVNVIDISAPDGTLHSRSVIHAAGMIRDKFKLNLNGEILTTISENWNLTPRSTQLENFSLANASAPKKVGSLTFGAGQVLQATRFDDPRVYVATGVYRDPLTVVDLSDPANPKITGELDVPGNATFIQPLGNRLVTLGVVTNRVAVSLFDVSGAPALLSRVLLGDNYSWSEASWDEKVFSVLPDQHLILVPFQGYATNGYSSQVQLIDLATNSLTARGQITQNMTPRRVAAYADRILSLSAWNLLSIDATDRDRPKMTADLELAWPVDQVFALGTNLVTVSAGNSWGHPVAPALRVAPTATPNLALNKLALTNLPVVGATVRDARLYLAQAPAQYAYPYAVAMNSANPLPDGQAPFVLTVIDLTDLPRLPVLAQTNLTTMPFGWGARLKALWPRAGLLVWASRNSYYYVLQTATGVAAPASTGITASILPGPWPWYWPPGERLLAFDVSYPAAPAFQSELTVSRTNASLFSSAFAANGLVYFSDQAAVQVWYPPAQPTNVTVVSAASGTDGLNSGSLIPLPSPSRGIWMQRHYLEVVDYADPTTPTVRKPASISGVLQGIARNGALLYTLGAHWDTSNWTETLDASAYDGVAAHLVDSFNLGAAWPHPVLTVDDNIFAGRAGYTTTTGGSNLPPVIETWTLVDSGKFVKLGSASVSFAADSLFNFPGLLAAHETDGRIGVFDRSNPATLMRLGEVHPPGCVWPNLNGADGAAGGGLWVPLGSYGVMKVLSGP